MSHLDASEIVDALDGSLPPRRQAHARQCARCREEIASARSSLEAARAVDSAGHEPSPLFWEHFAARVRRAIDAEPAPRARWHWLPAIAGTSAVVIAALVFTLFSRGPAPETSDPRVPPAADAANGFDEQWLVVASAAEDLRWEDVEAAGLNVAPGSAEHAALELSGDERTELVRLLEAEIARMKSQG